MSAPKRRLFHERQLVTVLMDMNIGRITERQLEPLKDFIDASIRKAVKEVLDRVENTRGKCYWTDCSLCPNCESEIDRIRKSYGLTDKLGEGKDG